MGDMTYKSRRTRASNMVKDKYHVFFYIKNLDLSVYTCHEGMNGDYLKILRNNEDRKIWGVEKRDRVE